MSNRRAIGACATRSGTRRLFHGWKERGQRHWTHPDLIRRKKFSFLLWKSGKVHGREIFFFLPLLRFFVIKLHDISANVAEKERRIVVFQMITYYFVEEDREFLENSNSVARLLVNQSVVLKRSDIVYARTTEVLTRLSLRFVWFITFLERKSMLRSTFLVLINFVLLTYLGLTFLNGGWHILSLTHR